MGSHDNDNEKSMSRILTVTRPFMPPREEFAPYLDRIWESGRLTNNGPIHAEFEEALCRYLGVEHICLFTNGTLALVFALKALGLQGEVITTPFTSVATLQAILWNGLKPVYADVDRSDLNLRPDLVEKAVTPRTCAILPVHIFGNPCDVDGFADTAMRHHLKIVYDAAHCFGVKVNGKTLCDEGDFSVLSFHATKVMNSIEGGAVICRDRAAKEYLDELKNVSQAKGQGALSAGMNAKMNEFQAAFGLIQLKYVDQIVQNRKEASQAYRELLSGIDGIETIAEKKMVEYNYSYFPVIVDPEKFGTGRDDFARQLDVRGIPTRKYFHPLLPDLPGLNGTEAPDLPVARVISEHILCLPLYHDLHRDDILYITDSILKIGKGAS